jgi:hypothetical protein
MKIFMAILLLAFAIAAGAATYSLVGSNGTPSVATCGTSPSVAGTDHAGTITTGSGTVTACTLNFSGTLAVAPACVVSSASTAVTVGITSISSSALALGISLTLPSAKIYYICAIA